MDVLLKRSYTYMFLLRILVSIPAVVSAGSMSASVSPKDNCRDVKFLQKKAYEAQIARVSADTSIFTHNQANSLEL